jgi:hypothetical protein
MGQQTGWPVNPINAEFSTPGSLGQSIGDLLYWDSVSNAVKRASQLADLGSAALMQTALARLFVGVSNAGALSADATARTTRVLVDGIFEFACDSSTFAIGDLVGPSYNVNVLRDQQVAKVTAEHMAIGRVVKRYASATTKVKCRVLSRYLVGMPDRFRDVGGCGQGIGTTAIADAAVTLTVDSNPILTQTPTADRVVTLPAVAQSGGLKFYLSNKATACFYMLVKNAGGTLIGVIGPGESGLFYCEAATWYGVVSGAGALGNIQVASTQVVSKTADYPLVATDSGTSFDNTGAAGSVNFTLPAVASSKGFFCSIFGVVDQPIVVTAPAGTLVGPNNAGRATYTDAGAGNRIGVSRYAYCNGAKWFLIVDLKGLTIGTYA